MSKWLRRRARAGLLMSGLVAMCSATAASMDSQRAAFRAAYATAQQGGDAWRTQAESLRDYALYPYLPAAALEHDLRTITLAQVDAYLKRYPGWIPADDLRRDFLGELARRQDWTGFLALYQPGLGTTLACDALQARLAQDQTLDFQRDLQSLWQHASLPSACDPVLDWAHAHGLLTRARLMQRIDIAVDAGQGGTVAALARWLDGDNAVIARRLAQALRDPAAAVHAARHWPDTPHNRRAAALAMNRLVSRSSATAQAEWPRLRKHYTFDTDQIRHIVARIALYRATAFDDAALHQLASLPPAAQTDATRAWRVRVALARQNWPAVMDALDALSPEQQADGEWQYFRARALTELGQPSKAAAQLASLATQATYYGFLAAERSGAPYAICPGHLAGNASTDQAVLARPGLKRAFELFAVDLLPQARREWSRALDGADQHTRQMAADLANRRGWYDRAIFTFSYGDAKHLYAQRFPLARQDRVTAQATDAGIDPSWAYAIIRAESAWARDAHSGADARGLMQLLPSTARHVARRYDIPYAGDLYDARTNIALGTHYLAHMAARYHGAPWLASAAYNAGPGRVDEWLQARGNLSPDLFVATIPYKETREYVARVMAYSVIYDWRQHGDAVALGTRMPPIGQTYALPTAATPRIAVQCPQDRIPGPAATGAAARQEPAGRVRPASAQ